MTLYEFEDRAIFFMEEIAELARQYPNLLVHTTNSTLEVIESNGDALQKIIHRNRPDLIKELYQQGHNWEVESARENRISVLVNSKVKKTIPEFNRKVEIIAKKFRGMEDENDVDVWDVGEDAENGYRYFSVNFFRFRA